MSLNILVIGNGGREHAIVWRLLQSPTVNHIYVAPGNGGTISESSSSKITNVPISSSPKDFNKLQQFAVENKINLVIPGPEQPLVDGIADIFYAVGIPVFGPSAKAAKMEGSKAFQKNLWINITFQPPDSKISLMLPKLKNIFNLLIIKLF